MMRFLQMLTIGMLPAVAISAPVHLEIGDTHVIVIRPLDSWDPNTTTASYSLDALRSKNFGFQYVDELGVKVVPSSGGLFREKRATPLSDEVFRIMKDAGFGNKGSHVYFISAPVTVQPKEMAKFAEAQNALYRASILQDGDPTTLTSRINAKKAVNVLATAVVAKFGAAKLGTDMVSLSQYSTLYNDISKLTGGANAALLPIPMPDYDFSSFSDVEIRRITDNAGHIGELLIAYRNGKTPAGSQAALAQAIAAGGGVGASASDVEAARADSYKRRMEIWAECQASAQCSQH